MKKENRTFRFGDFVLESGEYRLLSGNEELQLRPRSFELLRYLVEHHGHVAEKASLLDALWPDTIVTETVLPHCVTEVRQALNDDALNPKYLNLESEQDYFVDGMTDMLITNLSKIGAFHVISRTSAVRYKGSDKRLPEIAQELQVNAVVEGSVLWEGKRVRITAQLIEAESDHNLWAESYERDLGDILALQSDVAQAIAKEVRVMLTPDKQVRLKRFRLASPESYEAYLKGLYSGIKEHRKV